MMQTFDIINRDIPGAKIILGAESVLKFKKRKKKRKTLKMHFIGENTKQINQVKELINALPFPL